MTRMSTANAVITLLSLSVVFHGCCAEETGHEKHHHHHAMNMDADGMVMNANSDRLPGDCPRITEDITLEIHAGRKYAITGRTYGFDANQWRIAPCSRIHVTLINEDEIRHQWMVHGLPRYLYPQGMFHMEVNGGKRKTGIFIVPSEAATYLVHCDISQHMEQGMKAQLVVGAGGGDLPGVPGITGVRFPDRYP